MSDQFQDFEINLSFEGVSAWDGKKSLVAPGRYLAEITNTVHGPSSTGKPAMKITYTVVDDGTEPGQQYAGKNVTKTYSLQKQAMGRFLRVTEAVHAPLDGVIRGSDYLGKQL